MNIRCDNGDAAGSGGSAVEGCSRGGDFADITPLQNQADVGMGDQLAATADDIGVPRLADREARHHVADVLEVDLRMQHADHVAGKALDGHRDRHIRLGAAHKVDATEIGLALSRLLERFYGREIFLGVRQNGAQPRSLHLDHTLLVERHCLGDRRRNQQELFQLEAEVRRKSPRRDVAALGRAFEHVMDLLDEVFDLEGRAGSDFFLLESQLLPALVIAEINLDEAAGDQAAADEHHGNQKIIAHQAAAARGLGAAAR